MNCMGSEQMKTKLKYKLEANVGLSVLNDIQIFTRVLVYHGMNSEEREVSYMRALYFPEHKTLCIRRIYTAPEHERKGLAKLQLKETLSLLRDQPLRTIRALRVTRSGLGFFNSLGFKRVSADCKEPDLETTYEELSHRLGSFNPGFPYSKEFIGLK